MKTIAVPTLVLGKDTPDALTAFCSLHNFHTVQLAADDNTYPILGKPLEEYLMLSGIQAASTILEGDPLQADGDAILQLISSTHPLPQVFIAVGSGTITDVVRYTSCVLGRPFISIPTAPSVDAYTSPTSPLIISSIKQSLPAQLPLAVFADMPTLCAAPADMIAAGFGDMLGKLTALADWKLGHLLWDEPYAETIAAQSRADLNRCIATVDAIAVRQEAGIKILFESLLDSGLNMAQDGSSRPASGAEHHLAHYWEMKLLWERRLPILHGLKVGYATLWVANAYDKLRSLDSAFIADWVENGQKPDPLTQKMDITRLYPHNPGRVLAEQKQFLELSAVKWNELKAKIANRWSDIQSIAAEVPTRPQIEEILTRLNFPRTHSELNLTKEDITSGLSAAHYLRNRFTVLKLMSYLTRK